MSDIHKLAAATLISTLLISVGCSKGNGSTSMEENVRPVADSGTAIAETESIAGLPDQKDSITTQKRYTDHTFSTAGDALAFMQKSSGWTAYQEGILPQMASENLEYATKLLNSPYRHFIVVDKDKMKVILFDRYGRVVKQYGMAGPRNYGTKHKKGDSRTPEGYFSAEGIYDSSDWEFTDDNGVRHPGKCFGPRFIRIKNPVTTQVGIHGTSSPGSIGRRVSHGCIRLHDRNILELVKYVEIGMPVIIIPGPADRSVNVREGYYTGYFNTGVERYGDKRTSDIEASQSKPAEAESGDSIAENPGGIGTTWQTVEQQPAKNGEEHEEPIPEEHIPE